MTARPGVWLVPVPSSVRKETNGSPQRYGFENVVIASHCQYGASGMAEIGASFREILTHYYPNTLLVAGQ